MVLAMIQLRMKGSDSELQAKAMGAMESVRALYQQFGTLVIPCSEARGEILEFRCDDGWGNFLWIDWDVQRGLLRARTSGGEELVEWCVGADMRRTLEGLGVYDSIVNATWLDEDDDASDLCDEEEKWAMRRREQGLEPERVFIQRPTYIAEPRWLCDSVFEVGSICR